MPVLTAIVFAVIFPLNFFNNFSQITSNFTPPPKPIITKPVISIAAPTLSLSRPTNTPTPPPTGGSPTPKPTLTVTPLPTLTPTPNPNSEPLSFTMNEINNFRKSKGLSTIQSEQYTCNFATTRAQEISVNFNHDGFTNRLNSKTLPYPSYKFVNENIAQTSSYKDVIKLWINSAGHAANLSANISYGCVGINGKFFAFEGWKP